jgi:N-acetylneuraminic acid mutarotase
MGRGPAARVVTLAVALSLPSCLGARTESPAPVDIGQPGTWSTHSPLPTPRQEVAVAALDDRVVVAGGYGPHAEPVATVEAYRPATNTWETLPPLPAPLHHAAAASVNGRFFVIGGFRDRLPPWNAQQTVYEFDAVRNSWATRAPLLIGRGAHAAAAVGGRIYVVGGSLGSTLSAAEVYEPETDRWSRIPDMPTAREHLAAVEFGGRLWTLGGRSSFVGPQYASVEIYDPASATWAAGPPLPTGRGGLAAATIGDRVFVFGGEAPFRIFSATEMYEAAGNRWIAKAPMPTPRHGIGAAMVGGRIWVPGGATRPQYAPTDVNDAYTP